MPDGVSATDAGVVAAGVAAGGSAWGFVRWLFTWTDRRAVRRDDRLQAWEDSLVERETRYRAEIEQQLLQTRREVQAMRADLDEQRATTRRLIDVVTDLSCELETHAPTSSALRRARLLLGTMPLPERSAELDALAGRLDQQGGQA